MSGVEDFQEARKRVHESLPWGASTAELGRSLIEDLRENEARNERWAAEALDGLALRDAGRSMKEYRRTAQGTVKLRSGNTIVCPQVFSVPERDADGKKTGEYVPMPWAQLPWPEFNALIESLEVQRDSISAHVAALREIKRL